MPRPREPRAYQPADELLALDPAALEPGRAFLSFDFGAEDPAPPYDLGEDGVATITVEGPLEARAGWWWDGYGGEAGVCARWCAAQADARVRAVVLALNSPGGTCSGLFEALDAMNAAKAKPCVAFAVGGAYSAAYALATVADRVVVSRTSGVGSVGVIAAAVSYADALKSQGIAVAVVASGAQKTDLHPALPLSDAAVSRLRARVTELAALFAAEVGRARGMTPADVLGLQAGVFYGAGAVTSGLADAVGTEATARADALAMADAQATQAAQETHMTAMITILGLAATATPEQLEARARALAETEARLLELTGRAGAPEALAVAAGWQTSHEQLAAARAELAKAAAARDAQARATLLAAARRDGRVTPGMEASERFQRTLARCATTAELEDYLGTLQAMPTQPVRPERGEGPDGADAVTLTPEEIHVAKQMGNALEDVLAAKKARAAAQREAAAR